MKCSNHIEEIIKPLHIYGITYFNHIRIFRDGSRYSLSNNAAWLNHFFENQYYRIGNFSNKFLNISEIKYLLWIACPDDKVLEVAKLYFNIANGITIYKNKTDYIDLYLFASTRENHGINNFYINNLEILEHFIYFYMEKSKTIQHTIIPDRPKISKDKPCLFHSTSTNVAKSEKHKAFFQKTQVKQYIISSTSPTAYLTAQEYRCITLLKEGYSKKFVASSLNINVRTLRSYLKNAQMRLCVYSLDELFNLL